jgi:hypothetical protein
LRAVKTETTSAGLYGMSGLRINPLIREKTAEFTPIASASVMMATARKAGDFPSTRRAKRKSPSTAFMSAPRVRGPELQLGLGDAF